MTSTKFTVTVIESKKPAIISKSFTLSDSGELVKHPGGNLIEGVVHTWETTLEKFASGLAELKPNQAMIYGVCGVETANVVPASALAKKRQGKVPSIARDRTHFKWADGPGVLMLDYDPEPGKHPLAYQELLDILYKVLPDLKKSPHIWTASASSCIYRKDTGAELRGIMGQRIYIPVQDARDIPRAGKSLFDRLWLAGYGRYDLSKSGSFLERSIIDASVWQPERLDFAGGAECGEGLEQRRPLPVIGN